MATQKILEGMVFEGVLHDQATVRWRPAASEPFPTPDTSELIVFMGYFVRRFVIPTHPFLRKLLGYYGINLCHLHPNNILHISLFINLCKAFVGIAPHFNLFRYFFCLKPFLGSGSPKVPLNTSLKGWNAKWFYIRNAEPSLSADIDHLAVPSANWSMRLDS